MVRKYIILPHKIEAQRKSVTREFLGKSNILELVDLTLEINPDLKASIDKVKKEFVK